MLDPQKLKELLDAVVEKVKSYDQKLANKSGHALLKFLLNEENLPSFHPTYKREVELADSIKAHSIKGYFPEKLFKNNAPNQTKKELDYIKGTFKQVTLPVFVDYHNTASRVMHDSNWDIKYENKTKIDEDFEKYSQEGIKNFGSLENYFKLFVIKAKIIDANAVLAVKPERIPTIEMDGEVVIDYDEMLNPVPVYFSSRQKVGVGDDYFIFWLNEKSNVTEGNTTVKKGHIFEVYDSQYIYTYTQVGEFVKYTFSLTSYEHGWGQVPCMTLKGLPDIDEEGNLIWQSPFSFVTDLLDEALLDNCNLRIIKTKHTYPHRISVGTPCDFRSNDRVCTSGKVLDAEGNEINCPQCAGVGMVSRFSVNGEIFINPVTDNTLESKDNVTAANAVAFVSPPMEPAIFLRDEVLRQMETSRRILHINKNDNKVNGNTDITATETLTNLKALYAAIKPFSDQLFTLLEFTIKAMGWMRYKESFKAPLVVYPVTFDFATESDYVWQLEQAQKLGIPLLIYSLLHKYLSSLYYNEAKTNKVFQLIIATDELLTVSTDDIRLDKTILDWQIILHRSPVQLIKELEREAPGFVDKEIEEQIPLLIEIAQRKASEVPKEPTIVANDIDTIIGG